MSSRLDIPSVLLILALVLVVSPLVFNPSNFFQRPLTLLVTGVTSAIFLYAIYWGLVVRRGMAVRLYRNQALGVSLVSLGLLSIIVFLGVSGTTKLSGAIYFVLLDPWILLTFFWIDSSMRASQDLDPLSRDSLHWRKVRYPLWALNFVGVGVLVGFLIVTGNYGFLDNPSTGVVSGFIMWLSVAPYIVTASSGAVALPVGALRSRDRNFRRQLQWFALSLLAILGFSLLGSFFFLIGSPIQIGFYFVSYQTTAFCLYRSARSLVPLNKIQSD
jgi:hypothetical protein